MFGFRKSPTPAPAATTPQTVKQTVNPTRRTSSEPVHITPKQKYPFDDDDDDDDWGRPTSSYKTKNAENNSSGGAKDFDSMSVQELEGYAINRAEDTTNSVNNCRKIAGDIINNASHTLETLHHQGEQINRTHDMAVDMEKDLKKGEKMLNNLGGMFSKPWKAKKNHEIKGPAAMASKDNKKPTSKADREKLGLSSKGKGGPNTPPPEPTNAMHQIEMEKSKQDDALGGLSNILGDLKGMATDMGTELNRQNKSMDLLSDDVDELNSRVKGANRRTTHLLKK